MDDDFVEKGTIKAYDKGCTEREFSYILSREETTDFTDTTTIKYTFTVTEKWATYTLTLVDEKIRYRIVMMTNGLAEPVAGKGISEALIRQAYKTLKKPVVSSTNKNECKVHPTTGERNDDLEGEYRTVPATKIWKRLVKTEEASYKVSEDRFYFPASRKP
jgi:hypothetical protein